MKNSFFNQPLWGMAFRPLYLAATFFGALAIILWGFGISGYGIAPGWFWHAHEMIWGYAGAVVVGFLLTAVATWTSQPRWHGAPLAVLVGLWLAGRIIAAAFALPWLLITVHGAFFGYAAVLLAIPIVRSRNTRNAVAPMMVLIMGVAEAVFITFAATSPGTAISGLNFGLLIVSGFIGLIGFRVVPFFIARALGTPQRSSPAWLNYAVTLAPVAAGILMLLDVPVAIPGMVLAVLGLGNLLLTVHWWQKEVLAHPLLWILLAGYAFTALGQLVLGLAWGFFPAYISAGVHLIAVGGIGGLTLGMMARTAIGHTGRPMQAVAPMPAAFALMLSAAILRCAAALQLGYALLIPLSALCFAAALLLYGWRYLPWLVSPRADGKPG